jgi:hypothetical protein
VTPPVAPRDEPLPVAPAELATEAAEVPADALEIEPLEAAVTVGVPAATQAPARQRNPVAHSESE